MLEMEMEYIVKKASGQKTKRNSFGIKSLKCHLHEHIYNDLWGTITFCVQDIQNTNNV